MMVWLRADWEMFSRAAARVKLRQKQLNEERYARTNMMKIHSQWRKIMRQAKVDDLRSDIEVLSQNHEREVDRKDAITQMLDRDLEDSEEQYQMALRGHSQIVDSLMDLQYMRMKDLHENFLQNLKVLEDEFESEFITEDMAAQNRRIARNLRNIEQTGKALDKNFSPEDVKNAVGTNDTSGTTDQWRNAEMSAKDAHKIAEDDDI